MGFWDQLKDAAEDLVTLDVTTLTGEIKIKQDGAANDNFKWEDLSKKVLEGAKSGEVEIVAFSHFEIDSDAINFVTRNLDEKEQALLEAHREMVKAAQETRMGVVKMLTEAFGLKGF